MVRYAMAAAALASSMLSAAASPQEPALAQIDAAKLACVFDKDCKPAAATDTVSTFTLQDTVGEARLLSRTYRGGDGSPGRVTGVFSYWLDLRAVHGRNCVKAFSIEFGPIVALPYAGKTRSDIFVVTGSGGVGVALASRPRDAITIRFADRGICPGQSSVLFGLASKEHEIKPGTATLYFTGGTGAAAIRLPGREWRH